MGKRNKYILLFFLHLLFVVGLFFYIYFYGESDGNDSMPKIYTSYVKVERIDDYPLSDNLDPKECNDDKVKMLIEVFAFDAETTKKAKCFEFDLENSAKIFYIEYMSMVEGQKIVLSRPRLPLLLVSSVNGEYPGNHIIDVQGYKNSIVFKYYGWQNPEKIIKITPFGE